MNDDQITVFLADDHKLLRDGLKMLLGADPQISVIGQCQSGVDVVGMVRKLKPDVVLLDITLPDLGGIDVCKTLSKEVPKTAVVMLTMHSHDEFVIEALQNGATGYLLKDVAADEVIIAIRAASAGRIFLSNGINAGVLERLNGENSDRYKLLTAREREVLRLIVEGSTSRQIADKLSIMPKTVDTHRNNLMNKLDIHKQTELVKYAIRRGIVTLQ